MILLHLIIIGQNPVNGEYSIGLSFNDNKIDTINMCLVDDADASVCKLANSIINAPQEWYEIRKKSFINKNDDTHLIYVVTVPKNIKLKNSKWFTIGELSKLEFSDEIIKDILLEGIKL
jgi:hypothetical protein